MPNLLFGLWTYYNIFAQKCQLYFGELSVSFIRNAVTLGIVMLQKPRVVKSDVDWLRQSVMLCLTA